MILRALIALILVGFVESRRLADPWLASRLPSLTRLTRAVVTSSSACPPHVYVHVPFCGRRCSYCDFSIAVRRVVPSQRFIDAISAEVVTRGVGPVRGDLRTLYFGGGTPSKLGTAIGQITKLISTLAGSSLPPGEVTVEANPEDISPAVVSAWAQAGVNRVSLGVQSFDAGVLRWMHRSHDASAVREAVRTIRGEGIDDISLDLIYALPDSVQRDWTADLGQAIELEPQHLSLYGLTVEPQTPLGRWATRGTVQPTPEERYEQEFIEAHRRLSDAGFGHYEVSNYAIPGREAVHNSAYWSGAPYLGLGPSAHGFDGTTRRWNRRDYAGWLGLVEAGQDPVEDSETIDEGARAAERVYLGLRTSAGLEARPDELRHAARWVDEGWADLKDGRLRLTPLGWLRLDALAADLLAATA